MILFTLMAKCLLLHILTTKSYNYHFEFLWEKNVTWYCWYSAIRSFILLSASVNSISSIPSPVNQCRKAFLLNMRVNWSEILLKISWMEVEFPMKVPDMVMPLGGMLQTAVFTLLGIQSTKWLVWSKNKISLRLVSRPLDKKRVPLGERFRMRSKVLERLKTVRQTLINDRKLNILYFFKLE